MSPRTKKAKQKGKKKDTLETASKASLLVVNMRGLVNTRTPVRKTLEQLKLLRRFNATIVPDDKVYRGMILSAKEHVAWCKIDSSTAENLLVKRSEMSTQKRFSEADLKKNGSYSSFAQLAKAIADGTTKIDGSQGFRQFFRLAPPKGGLRRSTRRQYGQGGILGENKDLLEIVGRMI
jgi:large subunit ribosomal protein L30